MAMERARWRWRSRAVTPCRRMRCAKPSSGCASRKRGSQTTETRRSTTTRWRAFNFCAALAELVRGGLQSARGNLLAAAESLATLQSGDGAWKIDTGGVTGAPATYGSALATYMARRTLETAGESGFRSAVARANQWLRAASPQSVLDRAAILLALPDTAPAHLGPLLAAQNRDGGWGPQPKMPSEVFDTALAVLALDGLKSRDAVDRGRAYLEQSQLRDGSWPETTRPTGASSYAERISTAGWALYALLATDAERH